MIRAVLFAVLLLLPAAAPAKPMESRQLPSGKDMPLCAPHTPGKCFGPSGSTEIEVIFRTLEFERVINGHSFVASGREIRMWGVEAPGPEHPAGLASKMLLEGFLENNDELQCKAVGVDTFDRLIMHCFIDGLDLGSMMVQMGMATDYSRFSDGYYQAEEDTAKSKKRGIWGLDSQARR